MAEDPNSIPFQQADGSGKYRSKQLPDDSADFLAQLGAGDVDGPSVSVDGNVAVFDGTTGKLIADGGASIDSLVVETDTYLFPTFATQNSADDARLWIGMGPLGANTLNWMTLSTYGGPNNTLRDPSLFTKDQNWYLTFTPNGFNASQVLYISTSTNLTSWSTYLTINMSGTFGANTRIWSPEWFEDTDGTVSIYFAANPNYNTTPTSTFSIYRIVATNDALTTWSNPTQVFDTTYSPIDPFVIKQGNTYYLWYKNENTGQKYIEVASSSSPSGPFTRILSGDWAGWGSNMEGPSVFVDRNGLFNFYGDQYGGATQFFVRATSSSLTSGWSGLTQVTALPAGYSPRHGTPFKVTELWEVETLAMTKNNSSPIFLGTMDGAGGACSYILNRLEIRANTSYPVRAFYQPNGTGSSKLWFEIINNSHYQTFANTIDGAGFLVDLNMDTRVGLHYYDIKTDTIGKTFFVKSGTNAKAGTFTLVAGTVTVANTSVTANSVIVCTLKTANGVRAGNPDIVPTAGVGFTATSTVATDASTYSFVILEVN